jgi:uncharacterized protein YydD (DUF2326 family)
MIYRVFSTLPTFKLLEFHDGLNVVLAEKTPGATERQTRNRAGKSSITEIIHFLMGGNIEKDSIFKEDVLEKYAFGIEFDLAGNPVTVEREVTNRSVLKIMRGDYNHWPVQPSLDQRTGNLIISNSLWKRILGNLIFDIPVNIDSFGPSFRSLFSYFVRRQSVRGFLSPFRQSKDQQLADEQVNISFLIGLDWAISQKWQQVREQEKALKILKGAAREGAFGEIISSTADLRTQLTITENRADRLRDNIAKFRVLPEYREFEKEASDLTRQNSQMNDENIIDRQLIEELKGSLDQEIPPSDDRLEKVYEEAGIVLPGVTLRRFEEVKEFHKSVITNRRSYMEGEIISAKRRIERREAIISKNETRRSQVMEILRAHGALDHFTKLQQELTRLETESENIRQRYLMAERLETGKTDLELERQQLLRRLRQDYHEQDETLRKAILAFEEVSTSLYEVAGNLVIDPTPNGPQFEVKIQGKRSAGISNMQIFCFDMMLMKLCSDRGIGPGFLFHDSHLFDGVDERQVAKALQIGAESAEKLGFQYIVTMNEDAVPSEFPGTFDFKQHLISTRLTDATEDGGLFGIRFG